MAATATPRVFFLRLETVKGAAATAALTAVLELQKQIVSSGDTGAVEPLPEVVEPPAPQPDAVLPAVPVVNDPPVADSPPNEQQTQDAATPAAASEPDTGTRGIPISPAEIDLAGIDGLGAADRLGLGRRDEDEVGPTA